jgi:hypothetical protein
MNKLIVAVAMLGLVILSSCQRDWNCQCTDQSGNITSHEIDNQTLLNARSKCSSMDYNTTVLGITTSESCSLQ